MSQVLILLKLLILSGFVLCNSVPLFSHGHIREARAEVSIDTTAELEAEYICSSDNSISELKSLTHINNTCHGKDFEYDLEFWLAACRCSFEPHRHCPDCNEHIARILSPTVHSVATKGIHSPTHGPIIDPSCHICTEQVDHRSDSRTTHSSHISKSSSTVTIRPTDPPTTTTTTTTTRPVNESDTHAKLVRNSTVNSINFIRFG